MEMNSLKSYKKAFDITRVLLIGLFLFFTVFMAIVLIYSNQKIKEAQNSVLVINPKSGQMFDVQTQSAADFRVYQYELQAKMVYGLWYSFDENNYDQNIESAMYLLGDCGREMLNSYLDENVKQMVMQKNIVFRVKIQRVKINMNTNPVSGFIEGQQIINRASGERIRNLFCKFTISDCNSSSNNQLGCKINDWEIYNSEKIQ